MCRHAVVRGERVDAAGFAAAGRTAAGAMPTLAEQVAGVDVAWLQDNADFAQICKTLKRLRKKDLRSQLEVRGLVGEGLGKALVDRLAIATYIEKFGVPEPPPPPEHSYG